ncbi:MAG: hypothetical protein RLZZ214_3624 [Verrucomicrobiota bacterium]
MKKTSLPPKMRPSPGIAASAAVLALFVAAPLHAEESAVLHPYTGPSERGVDTTTLTGKMMCGYQGWFNAEGDGGNLGFRHWTRHGDTPAPGNVKVDLWPDVSELGRDERYPTQFYHADGRPAEIFSSSNKATVLRHFKWMRDCGIDGVFVQRFISSLRAPDVRRASDKVLGHCREGANRQGRAYAVMYDLSGLGANRIREVMDDWQTLRTEMHLTDDPAYLRHRGKPLVAVWGVGFNDGRAYTLAECRELVEFLKRDGCTVMLGVPTGWRTLDRDSIHDPALHDILKLADVISPWTVGRYRNPAEVAQHGETILKPDLAWCAGEKLDYLPVVFPGFSWFNMKGKSFDEIPRLEGRFLWSQFAAAKAAGATMLYTAMFDEVDEGTAIFKCTNDVPLAGASKFLTYEGLPPDHYLKLTGAGAKMLRGEIPVTEPMPKP